jgi:hypothetical protein
MLPKVRTSGARLTMGLQLEPGATWAAPGASTSASTSSCPASSGTSCG